MNYLIYQGKKPFLGQSFPYNQVHREDCNLLSQSITLEQFNMLGSFESDEAVMDFVKQHYSPKPTTCSECMKFKNES